MHRAETILQSLLSAVQGAVTDTERARVYPVVPQAGQAACSVNMLNDDPLDDGNDNMAFIDRELFVQIALYVKEASGWETQINQHRANIHRQLMTDFKASAPSFLIDIFPDSEEAPERTGELDQAAMRQNLIWRITYRHSYNDPEL